MNKAALKEKCKKIRDSYDRVVTSVDDFQFLMSIFKYHPEWAQKTKGLNVKRIEVGVSEEFRTPCFYIIREDDTKTDVSFITCINGKPTPKQEISKACRNAIDPIIFKYRRNLSFPMTCPITNDVLYSFEEVHIDHHNPTFDNLIKVWIAENGGEEYLFQFINESLDNSTVTCFTSESIKQSFIEYHNTHSHLRPVSKKANLSTLKKTKGKVFRK
ncbi:DUF3223 domain-containing protein [Bacteroides sp. 51]|uniref:DUF3223 domain-containing protein n=1 Tax=Bacteroides sp. 51 TaxID=2302938 RepID=UPI0013D389FC|nr:DUF3223 domain-containing protein [Bacteroides sp. 51]NDV80801.1 DUF3223 domain-containing protein [Bacteroides sp. 51]